MFNYQEYSCFKSTLTIIQTAPQQAFAILWVVTLINSLIWYFPLI